MSPDKRFFQQFATRLATAEAGHPCRLGFFGGTFDPPHFGHLILAQAAYEQYGLDGILFVPTGQPFYKLEQGFSDAQRRVRMLELALKDDPRMAVSQIEVEKPGPNYTVDTVRRLLAAGEGRLELFMIVGGDSFLDLPNWKDATALAALVTVLYSYRPGSDLGRLEGLAAEGRFDARPIAMPMPAISSSQLRERVRANKSLRYLCPVEVGDYVAEQGLYGPEPGQGRQAGVQAVAGTFAAELPRAGLTDVDQTDYTAIEAAARAELKGRLKPGRYEHSLAVAELAGRLAGVYGVSQEKAHLAGLLHDWDRDITTAELLAKARQAGIYEADMKPEMIPLLHAQTGAVSVAERFLGLPSDILEAIARHTVPKPGMSDLDMIIQVADLLEPGRDYWPVQELRAKIGTCPLEELFFAVFASELEYLVSEKKVIASETLAAWNYYAHRLAGSSLPDRQIAKEEEPKELE
ncbi:MAG: nicotinate-nucleotide adenylyltransferase [Coriobacteriia bacterium]|nr:nicotinate-nucleotide adenylyltransferase [Coriobacteriia bacterium]